MQPECIQAYVLSSDYFIPSSILGSEKKGENWRAIVPPLGEAE